MSVVNWGETAFVGGAAAGLYYLLVDSGDQLAGLPGYVAVGLGAAAANAASDWLASMANVNSALGGLGQYMKPVLVGAVASLMLLLSGGNMMDVSNLIPAFAFAAGSKYVGDYANDLYVSKMGGYNMMGGSGGSSSSSSNPHYQ